MKRTVLPALLASVLVLSGCGASEDDEAKAAISDYLIQQQDQQQMITLEQEEADCISEGMVDGIGVDKLQEYGFLNEDGSVNENAQTPEMTQEDAETMVDSMFDCTDVMATMQQELSNSMGDQPAEVKNCIEDALTEEAVRDMLVATFAGNQDQAGEALMGPLMECAMAGSELPQE